MRIVVRVVEKERLVPFLTDDLRDALRVEFGQLIQRRLREDFRLLVEELRRMTEVAGHAVVVIETLLLRQKLRLRAQMPLPDHEGLVVRGLELLCQRHLLRVQSQKPMRCPVRIEPQVSSRPLRIGTGQKSRA